MSVGPTVMRLRYRYSARSLVLVVSAFGAACGVIPTKEGPSASSPATGDTSTSVYLQTMQQLATSEPAKQADVFYEVERAYTSAPTTANTLRHALALVTPGHPSANLTEGRKLLEQLLANPERLSPSERSLATFLVKDADTRLQLEADIRRLTATVDERTRAQANSDRRAQSQLEENAKLKRQLDEAQRKLDAVKSIERSIIERSSTSPAPREPARD